MRWNSIRFGEKRVVSKFLLTPLTLMGETRWLETACVLQVYRPAYPQRGSWDNAAWSNRMRYDGGIA